MEALRSKRNTVLKSAMLEQIQIPFLQSSNSTLRLSTTSVSSINSVSSGAMEIENESFDMEIEPEHERESETPLSQRFSQSQGIAVQNDQEQVDRIDFSTLGENAVAGECN